jgi:hypothetical protein
MRATAREEHKQSFRTDIERMASARRGWAPLDVLKSTETKALFSGAIPQGEHTSSDARLARYLEARLVADNDIHVDLSVIMER